MHMFLAHVRHSIAGTFGGLDFVWIGRLLLTLVLAGIVGLERSTHERASGLRTHILVGLGACLITMAGAYGFGDLRAIGVDRDPFRLATYVVSGIGFLGAGAILRHGTTVRGLTTAASVWNVAGIGIAAGSGMGLLAIVTVALILFVLAPLQKWESRVRLGSAQNDLVIHLRDDGKAVGRTLALLSSLEVSVRRATVVPGSGTSVFLRVDLAVALQQDEITEITKQLVSSSDVVRVDTLPAARTPQDSADSEDVRGRKPIVRARSKPPRDVSRIKSKKFEPKPISAFGCDDDEDDSDAADVIATESSIVQPAPSSLTQSRPPATADRAVDGASPKRPNRHRPRI